MKDLATKIVKSVTPEKYGKGYIYDLSSITGQSYVAIKTKEVEYDIDEKTKGKTTEHVDTSVKEAEAIVVGLVAEQLESGDLDIAKSVIDSL